MAPPARPTEQRLQDTRRRLADDIDAWIATASPEGPYMVPLSFLWEGETLLLATTATSRTGRNLQADGRVWVGIGPTRDVVLVEGTATTVRPDDLPPEVGDEFATKTGFDPREEPEAYLYFRVTPRRLQAWREANELAGRVLLRDGRWVS